MKKSRMVCFSRPAFLSYWIFTVFSSETLRSISGSSGKSTFEFWLKNFVKIKVTMRLANCESFRLFGCSYCEIWKLKFCQCMWTMCKTLFFLIVISQDRSNQIVWNFHNELGSLRPLSMQSLKAKIRKSIFMVNLRWTRSFRWNIQ